MIHQFPRLIYTFLMVYLSACVDPGEKQIAEGVYPDGSTVGVGSGLSAGLDEDPFSETTEEPEISQQDSSQLAEDRTDSYEVTVNSLNTRAGPGKDHQVVSVLKRGEKVRVSAIDDGWARLQDGSYCSVRYLRPVKSNGETQN